MTGKEKCRILKEFRAKLAEENGIAGFEYKECPYDGECTGTCPACEQEALDLANKLEKIGKNNFDLSDKEKQLDEFKDLLDEKILGGLELRTNDDIKLMGDVSIDHFDSPRHLRGKVVCPDFVDSDTPTLDPEKTIIHAAQGANDVYKLLSEFEASDKCGMVEITRFDENGADIESFELNPETRAQRLAERRKTKKQIQREFDNKIKEAQKENVRMMGTMELIPSETLQKRKQYDDLMKITIIEYPDGPQNANKDELIDKTPKKPRGIFELFGKDKK